VTDKLMPTIELSPRSGPPRARPTRASCLLVLCVRAQPPLFGKGQWCRHALTSHGAAERARAAPLRSPRTEVLRQRQWLSNSGAGAWRVPRVVQWQA